MDNKQQSKSGLSDAEGALYRIYPSLDMRPLAAVLLANEGRLRRLILKAANDALRDGLNADDAEFLIKRRDGLAKIFEHIAGEPLFGRRRIAALAGIEAAFVIGALGNDQKQPVKKWRAKLSKAGGEARGEQKKSEADQKWRDAGLLEARRICSLGKFISQDALGKKIIEKLQRDGADCPTFNYVIKIIRLWEDKGKLKRPKKK